MLSNAITLRRDKSILYARVAIVILILTALIIYSNLYITFLSKGIGLFGYLFYTKYNNSIIQLFIILLGIIISNLTAFSPRKVWTEKHSSIYRLIFCKLIYYQTNILNKMSKLYKIIVHTDIPKPHSHIKYILKCSPASWFTFHSEDERFSDDKSENENDQNGSPDKQPFVEPKEEKSPISERRNQGSFFIGKLPVLKEDPAECTHKKFWLHVAEEKDPAMLCDVCRKDHITKELGFCYTCSVCGEVYCRSCMLKWDDVEDKSEEVPLEKVPDFVPEPTGTPPNSWVPGEEYYYSYLKEPEDYLEAGEIANEERAIMEAGEIANEEKAIMEAMAKMPNESTSSPDAPDSSPDGSNSPDATYNAGNIGLGLAKNFSNGTHEPWHYIFFKCQHGPNSPDAPDNSPDSPNSPDVPNSPDAPDNSPDSPNSPDAPKNSQESPLDYVIGIENEEPLDILDPD